MERKNSSKTIDIFFFKKKNQTEPPHTPIHTKAHKKNQKMSVNQVLLAALNLKGWDGV